MRSGCEFHQSAWRACANAVATCAKWEMAKCTNGRSAAVCAWRHLPQAPPELAHRARVRVRVRVRVSFRVRGLELRSRAWSLPSSRTGSEKMNVNLFLVFVT